jgi:hypothetical protein
MGARVDLVAESAWKRDAFAPFSATGADLSEMVLVGLLADDLEIESSVGPN